MNRFPLAVTLVAIAAIPAMAQESKLAGKYTGSYTLKTRTGDTQVGVKLDVKEVDGNKVKGTAELQGSGACDGTYPMAGKLIKASLTTSSLSLKSTEKGGRAKDCSFGVNLKPDGDKLVGKTAGGRSITFTK